jgi:hypothetical protein
MAGTGTLRAARESSDAVGGTEAAAAEQLGASSRLRLSSVDDGAAPGGINTGTVRGPAPGQRLICTRPACCTCLLLPLPLPPPLLLLPPPLTAAPPCVESAGVGPTGTLKAGEGPPAGAAAPHPQAAAEAGKAVYGRLPSLRQLQVRGPWAGWRP